MRPGRVDLQVEFAFASREEVRHIYIRMYVVPKEYTDSNAVELQTCNCIEPKPDQQSQELMNMAKSFAKHLPPSTFSPAEVQGFLLKHKDLLRSALQRVCEWRDERLAMRGDEVRTPKREGAHHFGL